MPTKDPTELPVRWEFQTRPGGAATLFLMGELDAASTPAAWRKLDTELARLQITDLTVDVSRLASCDSAGLSLLYHVSKAGMPRDTRVTITGLSPELQHLLASFSAEDFRALETHKPACSFFLEDVGAATTSSLRDWRQQLEFVGELTVDVLKSLLSVKRMRWKEVMRVFEAAGVNALPIVSLLTFLIGMVIAFESAQPLKKLGAQIFVANLLGLTICRELGPVMAAIMLAGRSGSAFAAELGTMKVNEELNALQTMGLSPVQFLVVQRVVAGLLLTPILTIFAMYAGLLGGIPILLGLGFPLRMVLHEIQAGLHFGDLAEGLCKSLVFGGIVASVSCLRGL